jgi:hypothetical protein
MYTTTIGFDYRLIKRGDFPELFATKKRHGQKEEIAR